MSQLIAALTTGAGVISTLQGQPHCEQYIVIGDIDTAMPLQGINIETDGESVINIVGSQPLCSAFAKFMTPFCATLVGLIIKVAAGKINKKTTYRFTNNGATTPIIFGYSEKTGGRQCRALSDGIVASSNCTYSGFTALMVTPSANVGSLDFTFTDGTQQTYSVIEADALFAMKNATEANGRLDAVVTTIDNRDKSIKSVRVNATTAVTVLPINY